jgi:hypothetical protein
MLETGFAAWRRGAKDIAELVEEDLFGYVI